VNAETSTARLSIVIPAFNEARLIARGQASIAEHLRGISYEVIVVDNGSTDDTAQVAAQFPNVRVLKIPKSTIGRARNCGAELAHGPLFVFLDADVMVTAEWAVGIRKVMARVNAGESFFGGYQYDIPERASLIERSWFAASMVGKMNYVGSANLIVSADIFHRINGFNEQLITTEDMDFGQRAVASGAVIEFDRGFHAIHLGFPRSVGHFVRREMWHSLGSFRSLSSFLKSKASIAGVGSACLLMAAVLAWLAGRGDIGLGLFAAYLAAPLLYVIYRFHFRNSLYLPVQYALAYLYLGARALTGIRSLLRISAPWHRAS
jgi:glycosyltransferase involved in cell wall biosynthesis